MAEQAGTPGSSIGDWLGAGANFYVTDSGSATLQGAAEGARTGGFYLSREAMTTELENLKSLRVRIDTQVDKARAMWTIVSPGKDPASLRNTDASNNSGNIYHGHLLRQSAYLGTVIQKMQDALGIHESHDQQAGVDVTKAGQEPTSGQGPI